MPVGMATDALDGALDDGAATLGGWRRPWRAATAPYATVPVVVVATAVVVGTVVRVVLMRSPTGTLDSDEAVVGLMARQFDLGHFRAFFWGQAYGGTIEAGIAAVAFKVFGATTTVLKSVPLLLFGGAAVLVWRIGRRVMAPGPALVAALLVWLWPANYLWWSIKARGFYEATLCLGLGVVLVALRIGQGDGARWRDWVVLGLLAGLGWWQSPQIAYTLVPAASWLLWRLRAQAWRAVAAVAAFAVGSLPWWWANLGDGFASLTAPPSSVKGGYLSHLSVLAREGVPMTLGLKVIYSSRWVSPAVVTGALCALAVAVAIAGYVKGWPGGRLIVVLALAFPFLHAFLPLAGTVAEGRYTLFALPLVALALAHAADRRLPAAALAAACLLATGLGLRDLRGQTTPFFSNRRVPTSLASLERALEAHGTTRVWSGYWVAYRLTFETGERVISAPIVNDRYQPLAAAVSFAARPAAHVYLAGTKDDTAFEAGLRARHIPYRAYEVGNQWTVYTPARRVDATAIPHSFP